ncbi:MAG: DUF2164 domain-containing protein [Planctomycetota bacterium]
MAIELDPEIKPLVLASLARFVRDEFEQEMGELRAERTMEFLLRLLGPAAYNQGVADAQARLAERVADVSADLHQDVDYGV